MSLFVPVVRCLGDLVEFEIVKLAARPCCFQIGGLLSPAECDHLIAAADAAGMKQATTAGGDQRQGCGVAWLPVDNDDVAASVAAACEQLLLTPEAQAPSPHWADGAAFENMQVLKYGPGGEFKLHHDANEQVHRILTVLLYLNGVGETWFPLATTDAHQAVSAHNPPSRQAALAAAQGLRPGEMSLALRTRLARHHATFRCTPKSRKLRARAQTSLAPRGLLSEPCHWKKARLRLRRAFTYTRFSTALPQHLLRKQSHVSVEFSPCNAAFDAR